MRFLLIAFAAMAFTAGMMSPLGAVQARAADGECTTELECLVAYSKLEAPNWRVLDIGRGWGGDGMAALGSAYVYPKNGNGSDNQRFQFRNTGDGSFQMVVRDSKKCVSRDSPIQLREVDCANNEDQKWYLQPSPSGGFMIRSVKDDMCLNARGGHSGQNFVYHSNQVTTNTCAQGDQASFFSIQDMSLPEESGHNTQAMRTLAAEYAMTKCDKDKSYCKWETTQQGEAVPGNPICRGNPVKNSGTEPATTKFVQSETSINSETVGGFIQNSIESGVELSLGKSDVASLKISQKFSRTWQSNYARTTGEQKTWSQEVTPTIPAGQWAWLEERPMTRKLTGKFVFGMNDWAQWEFSGDSNNPMVANIVLGGDGSKNNSLWEIKTGTTPPASC
ncbi:RICIN domain-containing protein [Streptomyces nigrescens]